MKRYLWTKTQAQPGLMAEGKSRAPIAHSLKWTASFTAKGDWEVAVGPFYAEWNGMYRQGNQ